MFVNFNILNQLGSPAINSNTFANRPAAGQTGRLFVSTDTFEIYRDNGSTWDLIGGPGSSTITGTGTATQVAYFTSSQAIGSSANLYWDNTSGFLGINTAAPTAELDVHGTGVVAHFNTTSATGNVNIALQRSGAGLWRIGDTYNGGAHFFELHNNALGIDAVQVTAAANKTTWQATQTYSTGLARGNYFDYNLSVAAGGSFSSPNSITALGASLDLTLAGNATIPSGARSGLDAYNSIRFTGAGTLTHNQGAQIRAYSNVTAGWAFNGTAIGTITHLAGLRALFPDNSGSAVNITNNYALLLNDQTPNTGTVTYTNRWGIYQEGASDLNYMAANLLLGSTTNSGERLQVTGTSKFTGSSFDFFTSSGLGSSGASGLMRVVTGGTGTGIAVGQANNARYSAIAANEYTIFSDDFFLRTNGAFPLSIGTNNTARLTIISTGEVGIGTSAPAAKLDVLGSSSDQIRLRTAATEYYSIGRNASTGFLDFYGSQSGYVGYVWGGVNGERMRLDVSGNLGIGVTPSAWTVFNPVLQVKTGSLASSGTANFRMFANTFYDGAYKYIGTGTATQYEQDGYHAWYNAPSGTAGNPITFTQAMTLNNAGNLLIGTTTSSFLAERLQVSGDINTYNSVGGGVFTDAGSKIANLNAGGIGLYMEDYTSSGVDYHQVKFNSNTYGDPVIFFATVKTDATSSNIQLGDITGGGNGTVIVIDDANQVITFSSGIGKYQFGNVPQFANNAAAIAAGYPAGYIYRITGTGDLKIVI